MEILEFICRNQLTAENFPGILDQTIKLLGDHSELIRSLADFVLEDKAGREDARKQFLGAYYTEVQKKVNWICTTAEDVWTGKYGNDALRKELLGADYDVVMKQVNRTKHLHTSICIPTGLKFKKDKNGKRYIVEGVPTSKGVKTWRGFPQGAQGDNPYNFSGSGCGAMAVYSAIATDKNYDVLPVDYIKKNLAAVGGTKCPISTAIAQRLLDREGIKYKRVKSFNTDSLTKIVREHLATGNPVFVSLTRCNRAGVNHKGRYAGSEHYALLIGVTADGKKAYLMDSSRDPARCPRYVDLWDICDHIPTAKEKEDLDPKGLWNGWSNCGGVLLIYL